MNRQIKFFIFFVSILGYGKITIAQEADLPKSWIAGGSVNFNTQLNSTPLTVPITAGGISSYYFTSTRDTRNTFFNFTPYAGKEISRHWTLGLQLQYSYDGYKADDVVTIPPFGQVVDTVDIKRNENQYGIGLFGRYVFNPDNRFMIFLQPFAGFTIADQVGLEDGTEDAGVETTAFGLGTSAGVLYELSDKFRLTSRIGLVGYTAGHWQDTKTEEENNFSSFSTNLNLSSLFFGFEFRF